MLKNKRLYMTFDINSTWKPWKKFHISSHHRHCRKRGKRKNLQFRMSLMTWKLKKEGPKKRTRKLLSCTSNQYLQNLFDRTRKFLLVHTYINILTLIYNDFVIFESEVCKSSSKNKKKKYFSSSSSSQKEYSMLL